MIPAIYAILRLTDNPDRRLRGYYGYGLIFFWAYYAVCFHWFAYLYPLDFTGINNFFSVIVIIVAIFGLSLLQALISAPMFVIFGAFARLGTFKKFSYLPIFLLPPLYAIFEFIQTLGWWGVPWGRLCLGQCGFMPTLATSSLFGSYTVTALIVFANTLFAYAIYKAKGIKYTAFLSGFALLAVALNLGVGTIIYAAESAEYESSDKIKVAAIQGNYDSSEKWVAPAEQVLEVYSDMTRKAAAEGAELIVWPETAYPFATVPDSYTARRFELLAMETGADIIIGTIMYEGGNTYNVCYYVSAEDGICETVYFKRRLVPFGEFVPMRSFIDVVMPFMSDISILAEDMTPGTDSNVFDVPGMGKVGSIICFDSIYEALCADSVRDGAELFAISTNDSWFSDSCGIYMHNNQARLRSVEFGRATVRAGNTGVSSIITPTGEVSGQIDILERGYLVGEVSLSSEKTLYSMVGNLFIYLSVAEICGLLGFEIYSYCRKRSAEKACESDIADDGR